MTEDQYREYEDQIFKYSITLDWQWFKDRRRITEWLRANQISKWRSPVTNLWKFASEKDAILFKLKWSK